MTLGNCFIFLEKLSSKLDKNVVCALGLCDDRYSVRIYHEDNEVNDGREVFFELERSDLDLVDLEQLAIEFVAVYADQCKDIENYIKYMESKK